MEDFSSTGQLVTLGLVDSSIGAMAEGLALVDVELQPIKRSLIHVSMDCLKSISYSIIAYVYSCYRSTPLLNNNYY